MAEVFSIARFVGYLKWCVKERTECYKRLLSCSSVLLENIIAAGLLKKFPDGTKISMNTFT
jgi:hypothetical protein